MGMTLVLAFVGAAIAAGVGTIWYSPATPMGRWHMQFLGFDALSEEEQKKKREEAKPKMLKMYGAQIVLSWLMALAVVTIVTMSMRNGLTFIMALGFVLFNWLCFVVPVIGSGIIWGNGDTTVAWKKFFSDSLSNLVTMFLIALVAGLSL
jgi:hypothetical protein